MISLINMSQVMTNSNPVSNPSNANWTSSNVMVEMHQIAQSKVVIPSDRITLIG